MCRYGHLKRIKCMVLENWIFVSCAHKERITAVLKTCVWKQCNLEKGQVIDILCMTKISFEWKPFVLLRSVHVVRLISILKQCQCFTG